MNSMWAQQTYKISKKDPLKSNGLSGDVSQQEISEQLSLHSQVTWLSQEDIHCGSVALAASNSF